MIPDFHFPGDKHFGPTPLPVLFDSIALQRPLAPAVRVLLRHRGGMQSLAPVSASQTADNHG